MTRDVDESESLKDPFVHRMIPTVAAVGLTLGASGCGGPDGGEDPGDNDISQDEIRDFCSDLSSCLDENTSGYDSIDTCVSYFEDEIRYYTQFAQEAGGEACVDVVRSYFDCLLDSTSCNMGEVQFEEGSCDVDSDAYDAACGDDMPGSM